MPQTKAQMRKPGESNEVLLGEVARALGIARSTAWARVIRGVIPAQRRGGRFLVQRRVLERLVGEAKASTLSPDKSAA